MASSAATFDRAQKPQVRTAHGVLTYPRTGLHTASISSTRTHKASPSPNDHTDHKTVTFSFILLFTSTHFHHTECTLPHSFRLPSRFHQDDPILPVTFFFSCWTLCSSTSRLRTHWLYAELYRASCLVRWISRISYASGKKGTYVYLWFKEKDKRNLDHGRDMAIKPGSDMGWR